MPTNTSQPAFACHMDALTPDERDRSRTLREELVAATLETVEVADGYRFAYPGNSTSFLKAAEWVSLERRCCPFLAFDIGWKQGDDAVVDVAITGAPGVKDFLRAEMLELPRE